MGVISLSSGRTRLLHDGGRHFEYLAQHMINKNTIKLLLLIQEVQFIPPSVTVADLSNVIFSSKPRCDLLTLLVQMTISEHCSGA